MQSSELWHKLFSLTVVDDYAATDRYEKHMAGTSHAATLNRPGQVREANIAPSSTNMQLNTNIHMSTSSNQVHKVWTRARLTSLSR